MSDSLAARGSNEAAPGLPTREQIARIIDPHAADYNFEAAVHDLYEYDLAEAVWKKADAVLALMPPQRDDLREMNLESAMRWEHKQLRAKIEAMNCDLVHHDGINDETGETFCAGDPGGCFKRDVLALLDARDKS